MEEEEEKEEKENQKYGWFVVKYAWGSLKWGFYRSSDIFNHKSPSLTRLFSYLVKKMGKIP